MNKQYLLDRIQKINPSNFEVYDYSLVPETFSYQDKIPIKCLKHGVFHQIPFSHIHKAGCIKCGFEESGLKNRLTTEQFIEKAKSKFGNKYDYSKTIYIKKGIKLTITCSDHGDFHVRPEEHLWSIHGCKECDYEIPRQIKQKQFIERANQAHNHKYDYSKLKYVNANSKIEIICPKHGVFWQNAQNHIGSGDRKPQGCPKCSKECEKLSLEEFIKRANKIHNRKYDYSKVVYNTVRDAIIIMCPDHGEFTQRVSSHLDGCRCKQCFIENDRSNTEEFIKKAIERHGSTYDYTKVNYLGSKQKVEIICRKHGSFWKTPNSHLTSLSGCPICIQSNGERAVEAFLKKFKIRYIREYRIPNYRYRYDFYLPEFNIYIEFNGKQHYEPVDRFDGKKGHDKTVKNDKIKKRLVKDNKGFLIIITYLHFSSGSVYKELTRRLKDIYAYWICFNGKVYAFKSALEMTKEFGLSKKLREDRYSIKELF